MEPLQTIVYASSATRPFTEAQLESLVIDARDFNLDCGVTGVLLYSDGNFMQCIEGPVESMRITYERIRVSRRHGGIIELLNCPVDARVFPDWQMAYAQPTKSEFLALSTARWQRTSDAAHAMAPRPHGLTLLQGFWKRVNQPYITNK